MATTTNYGWTTPDDTSLVKDGASAIRTLGSSIDTTVKNLNPETTVGDISYRSSTANTNTRLALGTAGQVLTVNSGATAPEWATPSSGGMTLISTTTLSGASVVLSSIPATYIHLQLIIRDLLPATDGAYLHLRVNGDTNANRYRAVDPSLTNTSYAFNQAAWVSLVGPLDNSVAENSQNITFYDYTNTNTWKFGYLQSVSVNNATTTSFNTNSYNLFYNQTGAISSITFYMDSGNITSGTALLYGVK